MNGAVPPSLVATFPRLKSTRIIRQVSTLVGSGARTSAVALNFPRALVIWTILVAVAPVRSSADVFSLGLPYRRNHLYTVDEQVIACIHNLHFWGNLGQSYIKTAQIRGIMAKQTHDRAPRMNNNLPLRANLNDATDKSQETDHFSARVDYCMCERGLTNNDLARAVGVAASTMRNWLSRKSQPGVSELRRIANALQVPVLWLMENKPPQSSTATPLPPPEMVDEPRWKILADRADWLTLAAELNLNNVSPAAALDLIRQAFAHKGEA